MRFYACCIDVKRVPMALKRPSDNIEEVTKFSFDIFLKYNPICNPLIRNSPKFSLELGFRV